MKKLLSIFLTICLIVGITATVGFSASAVNDENVFVVGDFKIKIVSDTTSEIMKYIGTEKKVDIPQKLGKYTVTSIGGYAFDECETLTEVTIPETVTNIGIYAFWGCTGLTEIRVPENVATIGDWAFCLCKGLKEIDVDSNNKNYSSLNGDLYNKNQTLLIQYAIGKEDKEFTVPSTVIRIGKQAFFSGRTLNKIIVPQGVTNIDQYAFCNCENVTEMYLPKSVTNISWAVFENCKSLKDIYYSGSEEDWGKIQIGIGNPRLDKATFHYDYVVLESVKLNKTTASIYNDKTFTLKATLNPSNVKDNGVEWKSSNAKVATVTQTGVVKGVKPGTAVITVTTTGEFKMSATCRVTVKAQMATKLTVSKKSISLAKKGKTATIKAALAPSNTYNKNIRVAISNNKIAKISYKKIASGKTVKVTAVKRGNTNIKFTPADGSKKTATCKVTVKK